MARCQTETGLCVECIADAHCPLVFACEESVCVDTRPPLVDCEPADDSGCPGTERCVIASALNGFNCVASGGTATAQQACETGADCAKGLTCVNGICVEQCQSGADCAGSPCVTLVALAPWGICSHCRQDADCNAGTPRCEPVELLCYECLAPADCELGEQCVDRACVDAPGCAGDEECAPEHCDPDSEQCVECVTNDHCGSGRECRNNTCHELEDTVDDAPPPGGCVATGRDGLAALGVLLIGLCGWLRWRRRS